MRYGTLRIGLCVGSRGGLIRTREQPFLKKVEESSVEGNKHSLREGPDRKASRTKSTGPTAQPKGMEIVRFPTIHGKIRKIKDATTPKIPSERPSARKMVAIIVSMYLNRKKGEFVWLHKLLRREHLGKK